jgi:hypothetical protein
VEVEVVEVVEAGVAAGIAVMMILILNMTMIMV